MDEPLLLPLGLAFMEVSVREDPLYVDSKVEVTVVFAFQATCVSP